MNYSFCYHFFNIAELKQHGLILNLNAGILVNVSIKLGCNFTYVLYFNQLC